VRFACPILQPQILLALSHQTESRLGKTGNSRGEVGLQSTKGKQTSSGHLSSMFAQLSHLTPRTDEAASRMQAKKSGFKFRLPCTHQITIPEDTAAMQEEADMKVSPE